MKLVVATRSVHKMREIRRILSTVDGLTVLDLNEVGIEPSPAEDGLEPYDTFEANARSKARYFQERTALPTVADDSGLVVDALDGAPGVRSKRFARDAGVGEEGMDGQLRDDANNRHLIHQLRGVAVDDRTARYVCVAALIDGEEDRIVRGEAPGLIVDEPRGEGGFGYDPHFLDPELGRTFAQISDKEKNDRSHRGRAFRRLAAGLRDADAGAGD